MADANGRIDLDAPLLSVRRRQAGEKRLLCDQLEDEDEDAAAHGARGGVPFGWERRPGHPKSVRTFRRAPPPPAHVPEAARFSDDALSRADSCFTANCSSVNGLSDAATGRGARGGVVMMDRFLQAAKAVAVAADGASPHQQRSFRKAGASAMLLEPARRAHPGNAPVRDEGDSGLPRRLLAELEQPAADLVQVQPKYGGKGDMNEDEEEEWEDAHSTAGFASRRCGLIPTRCARSAGLLLLLNPAQAIRRSRREARRRRQSETNPLLPHPRNGQQHTEHSATMDCMRTWEEVCISSLLRSDRGCRLIRPGTLASELDRLCVTDQAGSGIHRPKATHLGMLLVLDRTNDEHCEAGGGKAAAPLPPPKCAGTPKAAGGKASSRNNAGHGFPPLLQENAAARRERDAIVSRAQPVLVLPSPKSPSESWLSRALQPSVSNKPPPTSTFLGIHVQQHRKEDPSPWCSSYQTKVADHGRARHIRIYDLQK